MNMRTTVLLYVFCFLISFTGGHLSWAEESIQIPTQFTNRELLTNARWSDGAFFQAIVSSWDKHTVTQDLEGKEVLRKREAQICGTTFSVEARRFQSDGVFEFVFIHKDGFPKDFRQKFVSYGVKTWGVPLKSIDYSWRGKENSVDDHEVEWLLGKTHIKFSIFGAEMYDSWIPGLCLLVITQQGKYALLKDLIALKCEGQKRLFGFKDSTEVTPVSPFVIFVDLNHNALLRRDRSVLGKIGTASDEYFMAEWREKDRKHRFTIDRKLGTYEWETTPIESSKKYGAVNWGKCEKTNLQIEPKF